MDETGWSRRHVTERFRRQLGVSPKAYARLLRFEHASALLNEKPRGRTLADVAMEAGYYDQSHLTRDFVALAGMTPGAVAADAGAAPEVRFVQDAEHPARPQSGAMTTTNDTTTKTAVIPVLVYEDIEAAHDFLVEVFGFTSGGLHRVDDGTVVHAEVRNGDAAIWLHRVTAEHELASPRGTRDVARRALGRRARRRRALRPRQGRRRPDRQRADGPGLRPARVRGAGPREPPLVVLVAAVLIDCGGPVSGVSRRRGAAVGGPAASGGPAGPPGSRPRPRR